MYYAEYRPNNDYVCSFGVESNPSLFEFDTEHERNEWVNDENKHLSKDEWFPVSPEDVSARYDLNDFDDLDCSFEFPPTLKRTCAGRIVRYIRPIDMC